MSFLKRWRQSCRGIDDRAVLLQESPGASSAGHQGDVPDVRLPCHQGHLWLPQDPLQGLRQADTKLNLNLYKRGILWYNGIGDEK